MELVRSILLYFVAMFQSMITITKTPFIIALFHIVVETKSRPQIPKGTKLVSVHAEMFRKVNKVFVG